jgi:hypothetical protein
MRIYHPYLTLFIVYTDVPSNDGSIEVRMESFADVETVQSANVEMPCKALTRDKGVRFTYKWTTVEGGRTKPIPEVRSPLDAVNDKFVYQKYPNTSVLVINGVKESDLNMYTCIAIFNGKEHPESFKLEKKGQRQSHSKFGDVPHYIICWFV